MALRHQSIGWCLRSIYATLDTMRDAPRGTPSVDVLNTYGVSSGAQLRYHEGRSTAMLRHQGQRVRDHKQRIVCLGPATVRGAALVPLRWSPTATPTFSGCCGVEHSSASTEEVPLEPSTMPSETAEHDAEQKNNSVSNASQKTKILSHLSFSEGLVDRWTHCVNIDTGCFLFSSEL